MTPFPGRKPIFVDPSGRRHRSVRRLGALLAVPAAGYLVLLASSLLGGPAPNTPFIPLPDAVRQLSKPKPVVTPTPVPARTVEPTSQPSTTPTGVPTSAATRLPASARPTAVPTITPRSRPSTPGQTNRPTTSPTSTPTTGSSPTTTPGTRERGKPTAPPGRTKSPARP
ncbi:hypothetical protein [Kribbella deserti]|uniref:Uncharacterized protein n=1 Tax=Kribbella deserti TaxID=1926257 RepID=A0ABV6QJ24_9ACTN